MIYPSIQCHDNVPRNVGGKDTQGTGSGLTSMIRRSHNSMCSQDGHIKAESENSEISAKKGPSIQGGNDLVYISRG